MTEPEGAPVEVDDVPALLDAARDVAADMAIALTDLAWVGKRPDMVAAGAARISRNALLTSFTAAALGTLITHVLRENPAAARIDRERVNAAVCREELSRLACAYGPGAERLPGEEPPVEERMAVEVVDTAVSGRPVSVERLGQFVDMPRDARAVCLCILTGLVVHYTRWVRGQLSN